MTDLSHPTTVQETRPPKLRPEIETPGPARQALRALGGKTSRNIAGIIAFIVLFDVVGRASGLSENSMPRAGTVLRSLLEISVDGEFLSAVLSTLWASAVGLALAAIIAIPLGVILGGARRAYQAASALIEVMRPLPAITLIPPAILLFGSGAQMKIFLVVYTTFWILLLYSIYGVHDVDPVARDTARIFGLNRFQRILRVSLPTAGPYIYTGLRIGVTAALLVTIGAELLAGGSDGIGRWLVKFQGAATRRDLVYAGSFFTGLIGVALNILLDIGERRLFPWAAAQQKLQK